MNRSGIRKTEGAAPRTILWAVEHQVSVSVQIANTGIVADAAGKKIIKAGTPIGGTTNVLENRATPVVATNTAGDGANTQGILLHDADVTLGDANAAMLIWGFVNLDRIEVVPVAEAKTALKSKVAFIKD